MHLTITNTGTEAEAIGDGQDYVQPIEPGSALEVNNEAQVLIYGDKPDVREQFATAAQRLGAVVRAIVTAIAGRKERATQHDSGAVEQVSAAVQNHGTKPVRAILGDGVTDVTIAPGATQPVGAFGYVEFRELEQLDPSQVDGGEQPAVA